MPIETIQSLPYQVYLYALLGGILPALVWLWFWLREDYKSPEPRRMIWRTFIAGGIVVFIAAFLEKTYLGQNTAIGIDQLKTINFQFRWSVATYYFILAHIPILFGWAFIEEFLKYLAARIAAFYNKNFDEPIDAPIYMITAAVGFAAIENALFLFNILSRNELGSYFLLTGNLRFLGSTLLHIVCSGLIGGLIGLAFYARRTKRLIYTFFGILSATLLHALFNFFIITNEGRNLMNMLFLLWGATILLIIFFEKVKIITKKYV